MTRRGFTLVELLIVVVLLAIFAGTLVLVVRNAARTAARATHLLAADRALITIQLFAEEALRDATVSDVTILSPARVAMSRPIGDATVCADSGAAILLSGPAWSGTRLPQGGRDDAWLLVDAVAGTWLRLPVDTVNSASCPLGGPAIRLSVAAHTGSAVVAQVVEPVELSAYASAGLDWFGLTPASHTSAVQPFAGPLTPATTRFAASAAVLDVTVPPAGAPVTVLQFPLGFPP